MEWFGIHKAEKISDCHKASVEIVRWHGMDFSSCSVCGLPCRIQLIPLWVEDDTKSLLIFLARVTGVVIVAIIYVLYSLDVIKLPWQG